MVLLERTNVRMYKDAKKLKKFYLKVMNGTNDNNLERKTIQELSFVQSGLISQLTEIGKSLHIIIELLSNQRNSQVAVVKFTRYYQLLRNLLNDIHSGTRRVKKRTNESNRDKARGFSGGELSDKKEAKMEFKEAKLFEELFEIIKRQLEIMINYSSNSEKVTNLDSNNAFNSIKKHILELISHAEKLSDLLIDMGFDIKQKLQDVPGEEKNLKFLKKAEKRSSRRAA